MFRLRTIRLLAIAGAGTFCLAMGAHASTAQGPQAHMPRGQKHSYEKEVEKLEAQWQAAQISGDANAMDRLLADDYQGITSAGLVVTKQQQLNRVRNRLIVITKMEVTDMRVKLLGSTAIVTSRVHAEGTNDGAAVDGVYRYMRVYSRMPNGMWKIVNFESTRIPAPGMGPQRQAARTP